MYLSWIVARDPIVEIDHAVQDDGSVPTIDGMPATGTVNLRDLVRRLADRRSGRTEANVQSDLHLLLTAAPLDLGDEQLQDIVLEAPAGERRRIDVEVGLTVFEVKRDLRRAGVRDDAVEQLAGYVQRRNDDLGQRYVGVLTDGAEWILYHLVNAELKEVSRFTNDMTTADVDGLCVWLEGVLATTNRVTPTPREIERRLGAESSAFALDAAELAALYQAHRDRPELRVKRELWAKLLTTALGTAFDDEDDLFITHTLLVATAEIIGHAVVGFDPADPYISAATLMSGGLFRQAQIGGVVEADFFDWVVQVPDGPRFIKTLARRLNRFDWGQVEHDVMKVLYESVISADQRHRLGEYYPPDWLAEEIVGACVNDPLNQRVLDPSCGSGTFLFHAVRHHILAAEKAGLDNAAAINGVTRLVLGIDVHPVAVTLARVTYLLALGIARLRADDRPPFSVPVYLGDSVQWGQHQTLFTSGALTVSTTDGVQLFADELRFPDSLLDDAGQFDLLVAELAEKATTRPSTAVPSLGATFRRFAVRPEDQPQLERTFRTMCELHDQGRDHIWGYYVRNLARPVWLSRLDNRVDVLVGNPPWLAYRFMTEAMQQSFRAMSADRGLWAGKTVATNQDLSGLFVARTVELYLRMEGRFGFVMPWATLSRRQFSGFRDGQFSSTTGIVSVAFGVPWDLHKVKPSFFSVPACVVFGSRTATSAAALNQPAEVWSGRIPVRNASRAVAAQALERTVGQAVKHPAGESPYAERFSQGATVVPRVLFVVEEARSSPLGAGAGRRPVRSRRSANEKRPWRELPPLEGVVEREFVLPLYTGDSLLPFQLREPMLAVVPWDGSRLLEGESLDQYPGLADWWRTAEQLWNRHRSSDRLTLIEQLDYRRKLSEQFPAPPFRVIYSASGMYLAAAIVTDQRAVIEHALYWGPASTLGEARYVAAILNSSALTHALRPLQARGEHNPRHYDKYVWRVPIPMFDASDQEHLALATLAARAEELVGAIELSAGVTFQAIRRRVREALEVSGLAGELDEAVVELLRQATE